MATANTPSHSRLRRRILLGAPVLVATALTIAARPAPASAKPAAECLADLLRSS